MVVFDLDYTLWPFWCDTHLTPPLKAAPGGLTVKDHYGDSYGFYKDVGGILAAIRGKGILVGAASRTCAPDIARELLERLRIPDEDAREKGKGGSAEQAIRFFDHLEIYPGSKKTHFARLHKSTGLPYADMLFFDDENRNRDTESLGVTMQLVRDGVTRSEFDAGIESWRKRHGRK